MIKVQVGKILKIDKSAGWNFGNFITMNYGFCLEISRFKIKVQVEKFVKFNKVCRTFIQETQVFTNKILIKTHRCVVVDAAVRFCTPP